MTVRAGARRFQRCTAIMHVVKLRAHSVQCDVQYCMCGVLAYERVDQTTHTDTFCGMQLQPRVDADPFLIHKHVRSHTWFCPADIAHVMQYRVFIFVLFIGRLKMLMAQRSFSRNACMRPTTEKHAHSFVRHVASFQSLGFMFVNHAVV